MRIMQTMRIALLRAAAGAILVVTAHGQSILGPPSEANHFIGTPKGWVHPKTRWGEPDIQANLNMMQAAGIPLERCANATRFGGPPCDMNKAWWTEEEHKQRIAAASGRGDLGRQLIEKGEYGRALLSGVTDPSTPQRQTTLIVDPPNGVLPALTPEGQRRALEMRSGWSLPGESPAFDSPTDFDSWDRCITRGMPSSMMPYRYNGGVRVFEGPRVGGLVLAVIPDNPSPRAGSRSATRCVTIRSTSGGSTPAMRGTRSCRTTSRPRASSVRTRSRRRLTRSRLKRTLPTRWPDDGSGGHASPRSTTTSS